MIEAMKNGFRLGPRWFLPTVLSRGGTAWLESSAFSVGEQCHVTHRAPVSGKEAHHELDHSQTCAMGAGLACSSPIAMLSFVADTRYSRKVMSVLDRLPLRR